MAEYNPSKIIKDGNTYNFRDTTKIPLSGSNAISGDLIPATDNSIDVGSSTKNIKMLYTKGITIDGKTIDTDANGNMAFNGNELLTSAIKENSISHLSGWCLLHGGLLIQWGTDAPDSPSRTINFSKPFSKTPIVAICYGHPDNRSVPCSVNSDTTVTTTSFDVYGMPNFAWRINWIAIGEGA